MGEGMIWFDLEFWGVFEFTLFFSLRSFSFLISFSSFSLLLIIIYNNFTYLYVVLTTSRDYSSHFKFSLLNLSSRRKVSFRKRESLSLTFLKHTLLLVAKEYRVNQRLTRYACHARPPIGSGFGPAKGDFSSQKLS